VKTAAYGTAAPCGAPLRGWSSDSMIWQQNQAAYHWLPHAALAPKALRDVYVPSATTIAAFKPWRPWVLRTMSQRSEPGWQAKVPA